MWSLSVPAPWRNKTTEPRDQKKQKNKKNTSERGAAADDHRPRAARTSRPRSGGLGVQTRAAILPKLREDGLPAPRAHLHYEGGLPWKSGEQSSIWPPPNKHSSCPASNLPKIGKTRARPPLLQHLPCVPPSWRPGHKRTGGGTLCSGTVYVVVKQ